MQMAVVEFARNVLNFKDANSSEFNKNTPHPVIDLLYEQREIEDKGGTMRLGLYPCKLMQDTKVYEAYGTDMINERHRHRYELNNAYREPLQANGMILSGISPNGKLVEVIELKDHPWFVGVQFHPEFRSRPNRAHPLFSGFIKASLMNK